MKYLLSMLIFFSLSGCAKAPDSSAEYVGKWVGVKDNPTVLMISKADDKYMVIAGGQPMQAVYADGALRISNGANTRNGKIDKQTGHLIFGQNEFKRLP